MSTRRLSFYLFLAFLAVLVIGIPIRSQFVETQLANSGLIVGRNVNMVAGRTLPDGDPYLQRQNEPSGAASTRNPLHLLFGCNNYCTVDVPQSEGPLPGAPEGAAAGDAWLGVFKSYNGGESWKAGLLHGYPQDITPEGARSPLFGISAASDPTVRAGSNGMFYYSGIAFDRVEHGRSVIFVARFIDNNVTEAGDADSIKYLDTTIIDQGTSGQFADKPWIAVDMPKYGGETVPINAPGTGIQNVARHNVYMVYSVFLGSSGGADQSKIMFARSTDCGRTWEAPIKLSESQHLNQGTTIAVSPKDGSIILAWRRYASTSEPHALMACLSKDFGRTFTKPIEVVVINPFDQFTAANRFRTTAFPALAVDQNGVFYLAWSQRGVGQYGDARIVIKTSKDGTKWSNQEPIDNHPGGGHQIMPSLTYAGGLLMMTWYDTRKSLGYVDQNGNYHYADEISDPGPTGKRHTLDVWVAQAFPSNSGSNPPANPIFRDSTQVSRYLYQAKTTGEEGGPLVLPPVIYQAQYNFSNYPIFAGGTAPFMGDYIDITPAPAFLYDYQSGSWRFNTGEKAFDPAVYYIAFACNRDVVPPREGFTWSSYWPPGPGCKDDWTAGMRNQNIYSASVSQGILVGSPVNTKKLAQYRRSFPVFVKNLTDHDKLVRLTIVAPADMDASFWEFDPPQGEECPFESCGDQVVKLHVSPHSSVALTVFVQPYANPIQTFRVDVQELDGAGNPAGPTNSVLLNPDPVNTKLVTAAEEEHTPSLIGENLIPVELSDPTMLSAQVVYDPYLEELLNYANPDIVTPGLRHPGLRHDTIINPGLRHTGVGDIPDGQVTDIQWKVKNGGNTTSAYSFEPIGETPSVPYQLLIYRVAATPTSVGCDLTEEEHHELLLAVENPSLLDPGLRHPGLRHPGLRHNTFFLSPGEEAVITLRVIKPAPSSGGTGRVQSSGPLGEARTLTVFSPEEYAKSVAGAAIPQATNPDGTIQLISSLYILDASDPENPDPVDRELAPAAVNDPYSVQLEAFGGTPTSINDGGTPDPNDDIWKYDGLWTPQSLLYHPSGQPSGLSIDANGLISGTPLYYSDLTYPQILSFVAEVKDESTPQQLAQREFSIHVATNFHPIVVKAGPNGKICPVGHDCISGEGSVDVLHGGSQTFTIVPDTCFHIENVTVNNQSQGPIEQYTFTDVRSDDNKIQATFQITTYTITATAGPGGSISPSGAVTVFCGENKTFTITPDEGYLVEDVIVNNASKGPVTSFTFYQVGGDQTISAKFKLLESWVKRYNNSSVNGDDEASAIAVHGSSGNVLVTGYSTGKTSGADYYTISYNGAGTKGWDATFDGPAHLGDYATAVAADNTGNVYVTGYIYRGQVVKHSDYCTIKYDTTGKAVWNAQYDDRRNGNDVVTAIAVDNSGFLYITGRSEDSATNNDPKHYDYYTIKYNAGTGAVVWAARYNSDLMVNAADEATDIAVDGAGNVYVTGRSQGSGAGFDYVTVKYNSGGSQQWVSRYNSGSGDDEATGIAVDAAGNVYVTGRSQGGATGFDYVTIQYDSSGNQKWVQRYDYSKGIDEASAIVLDSTGNVCVTGRSQRSGTDFDYVTIQYDSSGNQKWVQRYDYSKGADEAVAIVPDSAGNVYVTGRSKGSGTGLDYLTLKYDGSGGLVWKVRYNNKDVNGDDGATAIALDSAGNVYVTGRSQGSGTRLDYATIKYIK